MSVPDVSVIIPVRNEGKNIAKCLNSVLGQDYPAERLEIIVIDGMSEDKTPEIIGNFIKKHDNVKLCLNPGKTAPCALNIGVKEASGDIILRVDAHCWLESDYVEKCIEYLQKTGAENVGGVVHHIGDSFFGNAVAFASGSVFGLGGAKFRTGKKEGYADTVFPGAFRREVFDRVGLFNEKLTRNQDIEFNHRIRKNGGKIFVTPDIKLYYVCRKTLKDLWIQHYRTGYWNIEVAEVLSLRHFIPLLFVITLLFGWIIPVIWQTAVVSYAALSISFSAWIAARKGIKYFSVMPIVFAVMHLSYGFGSLFGIVSSLLRNKYRKERV